MTIAGQSGRDSNHGLALPAPKLLPPLDPGFRPAVLAHRHFRESTRSGPVPVQLALERADGSISRYETEVCALGHAQAPGNFIYLERLLKLLLWSRGACRIHFAGPPDLARQLERHYGESNTCKFDAWMMGDRIYEQPFELVLTRPDQLPPEREFTAPLGRHWEGCRIGFDLGASDRKVAAVLNGQTVFSEEIPWDPRTHADPQWHFEEIMKSLQGAAAHLPRVDAIGGSSAGVLVHNRIKVASLFRGVPEDLFQSRVKDLFLEIQRAWQGIPLEVVNDGEVTALAGAIAIDDSRVLGVALGSSQAAGYVNREGNITSWLNELAFAPVDYNPAAPLDEWSGDYGCGVQYFSQQSLGRWVPAAGIELDRSMTLPERLLRVQELMASGDERAARIYQTIGIYLGYAVAHYAEFYDFTHLLILGRVTTGTGGELITSRARQVLDEEFPELAISFHLPDEKEKRHGQAMAAASLPALPSA